jgi:TPR repeat protein
MLAAAYLRRAAALGDIDAQYTLAGLFVEGVGVVADEAMAARWFGEAAKNGHVGAEVEYAILLFNGRGVAKDEAAAAGWFLRAANADNPVAQLRLARLYFEGLGVDADPAEAARWYLIAKANGLEDDAMDERLTRLDSEVLGAARAAAERWVRVSRGELRAAARPDPAEPAVDKQVQ